MVLYHKDFSKESLQQEDFWRVLGKSDEEAKKCELVTDKKIIALNRARAKALFLTEEICAEITVEQTDDEMRIVISKKI